jgi:hypothetical protein
MTISLPLVTARLNDCWGQQSKLGGDMGYPSYPLEKELYAGERTLRTKRLDAIKKGGTVAPNLHPRFLPFLFFPPCLFFALEYSI